MPIVRLFVTNLDYAVEEHELRDVFLTVGKPTMINIMHDPKTRRPRGFAFVTLDTLDKPEDCWRATLQGTFLRSRPMHIDIAIPKERTASGDGEMNGKETS